MIGNFITDPNTGEPLASNGKKLAESAYQPPDEIKKLFARVQADYQVNWSLQNRAFDEFDGYSLLQRARMDQQTFGAYVGAEYVPQQKRWRWKGRKNTARNMIIGILAHVIAGMLFPYCYAYNEDDQEDEMTAKVMKILIENHLRKAGYELKFLYMMTSALVNPAVFVEVKFVEALQQIKVRNADGSYRIEQAVDELLSGLNLNILPIDSVLLGDFFTFEIQKQPNITRVRRISYDQARKEYAGKCFIGGKDQFDYVTAGMTRIVPSGISKQTLYDIDWTEADGNFVQVINQQYRGEDLEVEFVGGVFIGNFDENNPGQIYNMNPFKHRRMALVKDQWLSVPVYNLAKSGFEPLDPQMRFAYYKSAAFKEFWDDAAMNRAFQLAQDGMSLDVIKPIFVSGVARIDTDVMVPGATIGMPVGAQVTPYQMSPNISAALQLMTQNTQDLSLSTQSPQQSGQQQSPGVTATAAMKAEQNAKVILGVFGAMIVDLVQQVGELTMDCIIMHDTVGVLDASIPTSLDMKYKTILSRDRVNGKDVTHKIKFNSQMLGWNLTPEQANDKEWELFEKNGGMKAKTYEYNVNPYKFARHQFSLYIDPDVFISKSMGTDQLKKERAVQILMSPQVAPFVDQEKVVDKLILPEYSDGDPDEFKKKLQPGQDPNEMMNQIMGQQGQQVQATNTNNQVAQMQQ